MGGKKKSLIDDEFRCVSRPGRKSRGGKGVRYKSKKLRIEESLRQTGSENDYQLGEKIPLFLFQ